MQKQNVSVACEWWIKPHSSLSHTLFPVVVIYTWLLFSYRLHTNNNNPVRSQFNNFMCRGGVINQCSSGVSASPTATPPTTPRHSKSKQAKTEIEKLTTKWKHSLIQKKKKTLTKQLLQLYSHSLKQDYLPYNVGSALESEHWLFGYLCRISINISLGLEHVGVKFCLLFSSISRM